MKKPDAFDRKRKERDKAQKRWVKSRELVAPAIIAFGLMGSALGGMIGQSLASGLAVAGMFLGGATAVIAGSIYVTHQLAK